MKRFTTTSFGSPVASRTFPDTVQPEPAALSVDPFRVPAEATEASETDTSSATTAAEANVRDLNMWDILQVGDWWAVSPSGERSRSLSRRSQPGQLVGGRDARRAVDGPAPNSCRM